MALIGIDIGGSGVRAGLVDERGRVSDVVRVRLEDRRARTVVEAVAQAIGQRRARAVGVGVPGFVRGSRVVASPNFPDWRDLPLGDLLRERLGVPVAVENDANAAALGAWRELGSRGDLVLLTLGTGVGGGIVAGGRLFRGATGTGAELGHVHVGGDRPCGCGGVGCLEQWCSTNGLCASAREAGREVADGQEVVEACRRGEPWAVEAVREGGRRLGIALVTLTAILEPDVFAFAGGLSLAGDLLGPPAVAWLQAYGIRCSVERVRFEWLGRADHLAIAGAAESAREQETT